MTTNFENKAQLGSGIYTVPDIARLLNIPNYKANRWLKYWNKWLGEKFHESYSWEIGNSKAVNFRALVEFYVFYQFAEAGVNTKEILKTHEVLSAKFHTKVPFADARIIKRLNSDGSKVFIKAKSGPLVVLDGSDQSAFGFIKTFFKKLDFDGPVASRLWPMGKNKSIVCDPKRQFGQPVIDNTNIFPETIYQLHLGGETNKMIAALYDLSIKQVNNAIEFAKLAA
jgi:uncharacterized protein (DUF433 family)